jgi:hypothetical protein
MISLTPFGMNNRFTECGAGSQTVEVGCHKPMNTFHESVAEWYYSASIHVIPPEFSVAKV